MKVISIVEVELLTLERGCDFYHACLASWSGQVLLVRMVPCVTLFMLLKIITHINDDGNCAGVRRGANGVGRWPLAGVGAEIGGVSSTAHLLSWGAFCAELKPFQSSD